MVGEAQELALTNASRPLPTTANKPTSEHVVGRNCGSDPKDSVRELLQTRLAF